MTDRIRCLFKPGAFSTEWTVTIPSTSGEISFFVDRSFVDTAATPSHGEELDGFLQVDVLRKVEQATLVQLPTQSSVSSRVWVPGDVVLARSA